MSKDLAETAANAGVRAVGPLGQASLSDVVIGDVGPRRSEWLPDLLEELLPTTCRTIRELAAEYDGRVLADNRQRSSFVREVLLDDLLDENGEVDVGSADAGVALENYYSALTRYATEFDGYEHELDECSSERRRQRLEDLETITEIGTGRGTFNAGLPVLEHGFVDLHRDATIAPTVVLLLDGRSWIDVDDNRTIESALEAIELLGEVLDVHLAMSPALEKYLERHFQTWCEDVLGLTEESDSSSVPTPVTDEAHEQDLLVDAWERLRDLDEQGGRIRLLATLDEDDLREVRDLRQDDEIGLASGSIDRYVGDLEGMDLVSVDDSGRYNAVSLTPLGAAAQRFITDDHAVRHPLQSQLGAPYPDPPSSHKYSVTPDNGMAPGNGRGAADRPQQSSTADEMLAATGDPDDGDPWVQWVDSGPSKTIDAWGMHDRLRAGRRVDGVNLVDHEISEFEDGRVALLSEMDDHAQLVVQWGGSLPTLARLPAALLSDRAFSKILEPSRVGNAFGNVFDDVVQDVLEEDVDAIIQRGMQVGWFSEDELQYEDFRARWGELRAQLLQRLGDLVGSTDYELRQDLFRDLHGLLASATALYRALGIDLTIHVRVPDTSMLRDDEDRYGDFLDFFQHTVPKQTAYGVHSGNRMLLEDRAEKLRRRLPYDVQADDPVMDLTASWVVAGPQASLLQEDLQEAIAANHDDVREPICEGEETAPSMEIPVVVANEFGAIKKEVERHISRKGFRVDRDDMISLTRACMAVLGTETRGASPFDVCEALLHLKKQPGRSLTVAQLENVLSKLPAERLVRGEKPTVQKMLKALLEAEEPLGRSGLIEAAGISENSYDRNWRELRDLEAFGLVDRLDDKRWTARLFPFWSDVGHGEIPDVLEDEFFASTWDDVLFEAAIDQDVDGAVDGDLFSWPIEFEAVLDRGGWHRWRPYLVWLDDDLFEWHCENRMTTSMGGLSKTACDGVGGSSKTRRDEGVGGLSKMAIARIGRRPAGADHDQQGLEESAVGARAAD